MNLTVTVSIPMFLSKTKDFLEALQKDVSLKEKLLKGFNFDVQGIEQSLAILAEAQTAQKEYENAASIVSQAKSVFENQFEKAKAIFRKDAAYLMVALKNNPQKQLEVGLIGKPEAGNTSQWLTDTCHCYDQVLSDQDIIAEIIKYHLKKEDFESNRADFNLALSTYEVLVKDRPVIENAINNRDEAITKLADNIAKIQALIFETFNKSKTLKEFKKLNLPLVNDEIGQEIMITMVKDSSIT